MRHFAMTAALPILVTIFSGVAVAQESFSVEISTQGTVQRRSQKWQSTAHLIDRDVHFEVSDSDIESAPRWRNPGATVVPLSPDRAVAAATAELPRYVKNPAPWRVQSVVLQAFGDDGMWFYVVWWQRPVPHEAGERLGIPVLLSGNPVAGTQAVKCEPEAAAR